MGGTYANETTKVFWQEKAAASFARARKHQTWGSPDSDISLANVSTVMLQFWINKK